MRRSMPANSEASPPRQAEISACWLVFAKAGPISLASFGLVRSRGGTWYRRVDDEAQARHICRRIAALNINSWVAYEADLPQKLSSALRHMQTADFTEYRKHWTARPLPAVQITAPPDRDRSSGRKNYDQVGTQAESNDE